MSSDASIQPSHHSEDSGNASPSPCVEAALGTSIQSLYLMVGVYVKRAEDWERVSTATFLEGLGRHVCVGSAGATQAAQCCQHVSCAMNFMKTRESTLRSSVRGMLYLNLRRGSASRSSGGTWPWRYECGGQPSRNGSHVGSFSACGSYEGMVLRFSSVCLLRSLC